MTFLTSLRSGQFSGQKCRCSLEMSHECYIIIIYGTFSRQQQKYNIPHFQISRALVTLVLFLIWQIFLGEGGGGGRQESAGENVINKFQRKIQYLWRQVAGRCPPFS